MKEQLLRALAGIDPSAIVNIQAKDLRQIGFPVPAGTPDLRPLEVSAGELKLLLEEE
jgi:hypothetical protein